MRRPPSSPPDPWIGLLEPALGVLALRARRMFGCVAYYAGERLVWVSAARREPWRGILVPTERTHHAALRARVPALRAHPVLGKWLYLPARHADFEAAADRLAMLVANADPLVGVTPALRASRRRTRKERSR